MDMEALVDYEQSEEERFSKTKKRIMGGEDLSNWDADRFRRDTLPIAQKAHHAGLWPQVPLFGSLIIPIFPVAKAQFSKAHGFHLFELPRVMDFSRETGRIQFALGAPPTFYAGMEYLDDLLTEFRPPPRVSLSHRSPP